MIDEGLFYLLSHTTAITSICGTRIYPSAFPPDPTYPAISYKLIGARPDPTLSTPGYQRFRYEFDCRAVDAVVAGDLRQALRQTLEGYNGLLNDGTFLQDGQFIQTVDDFADDPRVYRRMIEIYLFFNFSN